MENNKTDLAVGLFVLIGIISLVTLVFVFGQFSHRFESKYKIKVFFKDASGLIKGSEVRMKGAKIGVLASNPQLSSGTKENARVFVESVIFDYIKIPKNSIASISSSGLLGDSYIDIKPSQESDFLKDNDELIADSSGSIKEIQQKAESVIKKIDISLNLLDDLVVETNKGIKKINEKLLSSNNLEKLSSLLDSLNESAKKISTVVDKSDSAISSIKNVGESFNKTMLKVDGVITDFDGLGEKLKTNSNNLNTTITSSKETIETIKSFVSNLKNDDGLLHALVNDSSFRDDVVQFMDNLKITGILWYKDLTLREKEELFRKEMRKRSR